MKKLLLLLLLTSSYSIADVTSVDERFTLLCQADKITGFKWRNGEWIQTNWKPDMTIIKKHDYEKSADDDDWVEKDAVNRSCAIRHEESNDACYSITRLGDEAGEFDYVTCTEYWVWGSPKTLGSVSCRRMLMEAEWDFQINGEFVAVKGPFGLTPIDGIKDDIYIRVGKCSLL